MLCIHRQYNDGGNTQWAMLLEENGPHSGAGVQPNTERIHRYHRKVTYSRIRAYLRISFLL